MSNHVKIKDNDKKQEKIIILTTTEIDDIVSKLATYKEIIDKGYKITPNRQKRDLLAVESCEIKKLIDKLRKE